MIKMTSGMSADDDRSVAHGPASPPHFAARRDPDVMSKDSVLRLRYDERQFCQRNVGVRRRV
jgi:hypothetical protein